MSTTKYSTDRHPVPLEAGDVAIDEEGTEARVLVVDRPGDGIDEWEISPGDGDVETTIYEYGRGRYPVDDDVLLAIYEDSLEEYLDGLGRQLNVDRVVDVLRALEVEELENRRGDVLRVYAFPESRLGRV